MATLSSHINVYNTCLLILKKEGFTVRCEEVADNDIQPLLWLARKGDYEFCADNPIELLGLVKIYEYKKPEGNPKPYWWVVDGEDLYNELVD